MNIMTLNAAMPTAAASPAKANTSARPAEEAWVVNDGVSLSSADLEAGKATIPADGLKASYTYQRSALHDAGMGAALGALGGLLLPGIVVPILGFAAVPITLPIGALLGAFTGAVCDHTSAIEGTLKQDPQAGLVFEPTDLDRFGVVNVHDHANAAVGESQEAWYLR